MADVNEELIKEAIRKAEEKAKAEAKDQEESAEEAAEAQDADEAETSKEQSADENLGEADEADSQDVADDSKKKVSFFGKKDKKDKKDEQIADLNDKLLRNLAEFENFRKRTDKEKSQMFEIGAKSIVEKILPTVDNFERGLATVPEDKKDDPFVQGMEKIYKQMLASLEEAGVKPIEAVGQEFNPDLHNAVMHEENDQFGENIVSEEFQKGYMYRDSVVRHSMVKVAN